MEKNPYWGADGPRQIDEIRLSAVLGILASLNEHTKAAATSPAAAVWQAFADGLDDLRAETLDVLAEWQAEAMSSEHQSCALDAVTWQRLRRGRPGPSAQGRA